MTRRITLVLTLALLTSIGAANGGGLDVHVADLKVVVTDRVDEIGPTPATKEESKEAKKLGKALDFIGAYVGNDDIADLKSLGKALKQIYKSKTTYADIEHEVGQLLQAAIDLAQAKKGLGEDVLSRLYGEKYRNGVLKLLDKGEAFLQSGRDLRDLDSVKCHKMVMKAWKAFLKSIGKGEKFEEKAKDAWPDSLAIINQPLVFAISCWTGSHYYVRDVIFTGNYRDQATGAVLASPSGASMKAVVPETFVAMDKYNGPNVLPRMYPGDQIPPLFDLWGYLSSFRSEAYGGTGLYSFTGNIVIVISTKMEPGGGERIYSIMIPVNGRTS